MVRLKFLLFAFLVIGLGLAHLPMLSGPLRARAVDGATAQSASGVAEVARRVDARRAEVQALALKLAATPDVASAVHALLPPKPVASVRPPSRDKDKADDKDALQPLTAERFTAVRTAVEAVLPKELKGAVVALAAPDAAFHAVAGAEPSSDATKLDVAALAKAGTSVVDALGAAHVFASVPVLWGGDFGMQPAVTLVVGAPLLDEGALEAAVQATGVSALGLVKGDSVTAVGPDKLLAEGSLAQVAANASGVVLRRGSLQNLGPLGLPLMTEGDAMGGKAPLSVGSRRALEGTPLEVLAVAGTQPVLGALADYQQNALVALAGLLGLTLVWTVLMGGSRSGSGDDVQGTSDTLSLSAAMAANAQMHAQVPHAPQPVAPTPTPGPLPDPFASAPFAAPPTPGPLPDPFARGAPPPAVAPLSDPFSMAPPPPAAQPFGSADPFSMAPPPPAAHPFGSGDPFALPPPAPAPVSNPFASADPFAQADAFPFPAPPPAIPPPPAASPFGSSGASMPFEPEPGGFSASGEPLSTASPRRGAFAFEDQPTAAYTLQQAANPFALAAAQSPDNPETTRVAAIPRELLQASARPAEVPIPLPPRAGGPAAIPLPGAGPSGNSAVALSEEQHFQEVFREFVTTRERCGEPADGLTYDKFVQKLRKNKEQLVQKYACKTVRFQVYVKEGKAALKATPVKD
ncbi:cell division protein FtsK [Myxococcus sp. CA056]|uniref:MXAN_5187 family protein n=1 Tax=unclassified Myxococcus TaxID=2648731 RepID=UPI00157A3BC0|nr:MULTISPECIES: MXAN_5187 family protein [unclassified Myxococcus]NTX12196.1 cell division protein FtsK [Myxococcus sp. CA056]NTX55858.1 cell division protein FtsK [Myxococcus sp. CA039A]